MFGPTGGYLLGFVVAAVVVDYLAEKGWDRSVKTAVLAMLIGDVVIFACGLTWLGSVIGWEKPILELGLYPFAYGELLKIALAAVVLPIVWKLVGKTKT